MSDRSWFFAVPGPAAGPLSRKPSCAQFVARGTVTAETLVWTEGMAGWQKAAEIPGLIAGAAGMPPAVPQSGGLPP